MLDFACGKGGGGGIRRRKSPTPEIECEHLILWVVEVEL